MQLLTPPSDASWTHTGDRAGFEATFFTEVGTGHRMTGNTTALEPPVLWSVGYDVTVDDSWQTLAVRAWNLTAAGVHELTLSRDTAGRWIANGEPQPALDGCIDVDFESSAVTNTLPLHRLDFTQGIGVDVPAAFVRADDLRVERLEQRYTLLTASRKSLLFRYESSTFEFACELLYDRAGLVVQYPGIAVRRT